MLKYLGYYDVYRICVFFEEEREIWIGCIKWVKYVLFIVFMIFNILIIKIVKENEKSLRYRGVDVSW